MREKILSLFTISFLMLGISGTVNAKVKRQRTYYTKRYVDPVIKEMIDRDKKLLEQERKKTEEIDKKYRELEKKKKENRKVLRFSFEGVVKPASPQAFKYRVWHFPPVAQYLTGTCWDFSTTSFFESEVYRLTGQKIKLSEMYTAYWEYVEKARRYVRERGHSFFGQGSESDAVPRIWKKYGIVPASAYKGVTAKDGRYDHYIMFRRMKEFLQYCRQKNFWDEKIIIKHIRAILDKYMGRPPEKFVFRGKEYTPKQFLEQVLRLNLDDYVGFMSTLSVPFYTTGLFDVPDNWRRARDYHNVPLKDFYWLIKNAITHGYSLVIGGDVTEPGYNGFEDAAIIPDFDIPPRMINQSAREFRIYNKTTTDDHGIHLVGYTKVKGWDWFLIKDSARSSRWGKFKGYYFYREDYIKLKMLTIFLHKDPAKPILEKFK